MIATGGPLAASPDQSQGDKARGQCARALVRVPGLLGEACQGLGVANTRLLYAAVARRAHAPAVLLGAVEAGFRSTGTAATSTATEKGVATDKAIRWLELELLGVLVTATFSGIEPVGGRPVNVAELGRRIKVGTQPPTTHHSPPTAHDPPPAPHDPPPATHHPPPATHQPTTLPHPRWATRCGTSGRWRVGALRTSL